MLAGIWHMLQAMLNLHCMTGKLILLAGALIRLATMDTIYNVIKNNTTLLVP